MIVYNLACDNAHRFEGWFSSAEDFDRQLQEGKISCPVCRSADIARRPSAPYLNGRASAGEDRNPSAPTAAEALEIVRRKYLQYIFEHTEDVGERFPDEARRIHYREAPLRSIRGQASRSEVQDLRDEGIDVHLIPGVPVPPDQLH
ncbi:MAG TPA: DUF1178 family protein [Burkholderiales bacterium]|jgi:hypothetical protein|nr:DUF1178 family protein [Burkholderiales bacterium]